MSSRDSDLKLNQINSGPPLGCIPGARKRSDGTCQAEALRCDSRLSVALGGSRGFKSKTQSKEMYE